MPSPGSEFEVLVGVLIWKYILHGFPSLAGHLLLEPVCLLGVNAQAAAVPTTSVALSSLFGLGGEQRGSETWWIDKESPGHILLQNRQMLCSCRHAG